MNSDEIIKGNASTGATSGNFTGNENDGIIYAIVGYNLYLKSRKPVLPRSPARYYLSPNHSARCPSLPFLRLVIQLLPRLRVKPGHLLLPCSPTRQSFHSPRLSLSAKHLPNAFSLPVLHCSTSMASSLSRHPVLHQLTSQLPHIQLHQESTHVLRRIHRRKRFHTGDVRQFHGKRERRNNISYRGYDPHLISNACPTQLSSST